MNKLRILPNTIWAFLVGSVVKNSPANEGDMGQEDPLEKEMATHFNILAWGVPWTEEPGRLQSMRSQKKVGCDLATEQPNFPINSVL